MYLFVLLLFFYCSIGACESKFSFILTDQHLQEKTLVMDKSELNRFPLLKNLDESPVFLGQVQKISYECLPYEVFVHILKPFYLWMESIKCPSTENDPIKKAFFKTEETIRWLYSKENFNGFKESFWNRPCLLGIAYKVADFLQMQMPFEVKRGFINFLYDHEIAGFVVDESELISNKAGYLISSKEFDEIINKKLGFTCMNWPSGDAVEDRKRVYFCYADKDIRYFDPSSVSKERITWSGSDSFYFNFTKNRIQDIDFDQLVANITTLANDFDFSQRPIIDFRNNPLSRKTKQIITRLVNENQDNIKNKLNTLRLRRKNLEHENKNKLLYPFVLKSITILGLSTCLIRFLYMTQPIKKYFGFSLFLGVLIMLLAANKIFSFYMQFQNSNYDYSRKLKEQDKPEKKRSAVGLLNSPYLLYKVKISPMPVYDNLFYIVYD